jgi:hypothetical protein
MDHGLFSRFLNLPLPCTILLLTKTSLLLVLLKVALSLVSQRPVSLLSPPTVGPGCRCLLREQCFCNLSLETEAQRWGNTKPA